MDGNRGINRRLLVATLIAVGAIAPALYLWHGHQVRRNAATLLQRASELEAEGRIRDAADYVSRYVNLVPNDAAARVRFARLYAKSAESPAQRRRAIELYYAAVGVTDGATRLECRRELLPLLLDAERFEEVIQQAEMVLSASRDDRSAWRARGLALFAGYRDGSLTSARADRRRVFDQVHSAWERQRDDIELAGALAIVYREHAELLPNDQPHEAAEREQAANGVMDLLIAASQRNPLAYISRHLYRRRYRLPGEEQDLERAVELGRDHLAVQSLAARYWTDLGRELRTKSADDAARQASDQAFARAGDIYQHIIDNLAAGAEYGYVGLGDIHAQQDRVGDAQRVWETGLQRLNGKSFPLHLRLVEVLTDSRQVDAALAHLKALESVPRPLPARGDEADAVDQLLDLLGAQLKVIQGDLDAAEQDLQRVTLAGRFNPSVAARAQRAWYALGEARGRIGAWDQAARSFEEALRLLPQEHESQFGAAVAWHQAHRLDLAIPYYLQLVQRVASVELWLALAQADLEHNANLPALQRDWKPAREALAKARAALAQSPSANREIGWRVPWIEAAIVAAGAEREVEPGAAYGQACQSLKSVEEQWGNNAECLTEVALSYARWGDQASAGRVSDQLKSLVGGDHRWVAVRAALDAAQGRHADAKRLIADRLATAKDPQEQLVLQRTRAGVCLLDRDLPGVRTALEALHRIEPWNLQTTAQLAELEIQSGDVNSAEELRKELEAAGSSGRPLALYCRCLSLLHEARDAQDPRFIEARELQQQLERERPSWPTSFALKGRLDEQQGLMTQAAENYAKAIALGERRPWVLERRVIVLNQLRRFAEAETVLQRLQSLGPLSNAMRLPVASGDNLPVDELLAMARRATERNPRDVHARVWLGNLLLRGGQRATDHSIRTSRFAEAKTHFDAAIAAAPRESSAWNGLFNYHLYQGDLGQAKSVLESMVAQCAFPEDQRAFVLAQGYEAMGDTAAAEAQYRRAAELSSGNPLIVVRQAGLYYKSSPGRAERLLRDALERQPNSPDIRRALAVLLGGMGSNDGVHEALALLESSLRPDQRSSDDLRLRAQLLLRLTRDVVAAQRESRALLETLAGRTGEATAADLVLLAQVCERLLDVQVARRYFATAAVGDDCPAEQLAVCISALLRYGEPRAAETALARLELIAPETVEAVALRAQWLHAADRDAEVKRVVEPWAARKFASLNDDNSRAEQAAAAARIYESAALFADGEPWRRKAFALSPVHYSGLALNLAMQGAERRAEAIALCQQAMNNDRSTRSAVALASVVVAAGAAPDQAAAVEDCRAVLAEHPDDVELLVSLANIDVTQGDLTAAIEKYERLRKLRPNDADVMNNLAALLAEFPERGAEAMRLIGMARDRAGDSPELLDTEGLILLQQGEFDAAMRRFQKAAATTPGDSRFQLHLAAAYQRAALDDKARAALQGVQPLAFDSRFLTRKDRQLWTELRRELGVEDP